MNRRLQREIIVLSLYSIELSNNNIYDTVHFILQQKNVASRATDFIIDCIKGVIENKEKIDEIISLNLVNYKIERLSLLDLAIIRFATYELLLNEINYTIIINEAIELTKLYSDLGDKKAPAFNNKLLDNIKTYLYESS